MSSRARNTAFTLIEMLVVIAIISILAAISLPVVGRALQNAKKSKAATEVKAIETAVKAYYNDYSRFPHQSGNVSDWVYGDGQVNNRNLINVLRAVDGPGNENHAYNTRRILYLEVGEGQLNDSGDFMDPWGNQYRIGVDTGFDNDVRLPSPYGVVRGRSVVVWSVGPDVTSTNDDIRSW